MKLKAQVKQAGTNGSAGPAWLVIDPTAGACFLLSVDARGAHLSDTWHATVEEAKAQALRQFGIVEAYWVEVDDAAFD